MQATTPDNVTVVIYHAMCLDGTAAAWAVRHYTRMYHPTKQIRWIAARLGHDLPTGLFGEHVMIVDFSYNQERIKTLMNQVASLMILDHHKTSEEELKAVPAELKCFDMNRSGCGITWDYCFPNQPMPTFLECIQDKDIWTFKHPMTKDFGNYLNQVDTSNTTEIFRIYDELLQESEFSRAVEKGKCFGELNSYYINQTISKIDVSLCRIGNRYYHVGTVNSTILKSEVGNAIMEQNPLLDFAVVTSIGPTNTYISLRSRNDRIDVSEVARLFQDSGGHRNASGVRLDVVTARLPGLYFEIDLRNHLPKLEFSNPILDDVQFNIAILHYDSNRNHVASYLAQYRNGVQIAIAVAQLFRIQHPDRIHAVAVGNYSWQTKTTGYVIRTST